MVDENLYNDNINNNNGSVSNKIFIKLILILIALNFIFAAFVIVNVNFLQLNGDGTAITKNIEAVGYSSSIFPTVGSAYNNGFAYQLFSVIISTICGITILDFQYLYRPFLIFIPLICSYLFFSSFFTNKKIILLSMTLLFLSPISLFILILPSYGIMIISFLLLLFYLLIKYFKKYNKLLLIPLLVVLIMVNSTNIFFALFINISIFPIILLNFYRKKSDFTVFFFKSHLIIIVWIISIIIMVYTYPVMFDFVNYLVKSIISTKPSSFVSSVPSTYSYVAEAWKNPIIYWFGIVLYNITILPLSLLLFCYMMYLLTIKKIKFKLQDLTILSTFGIIGLMVFCTILIDAAGAYGLAANFQLRATLIIIPFSILVIGLFITTHNKNVISIFLTSKYIFVLLTIFLIGSFVYVTADPNFSNSWRFSNNYEKNSIFWLDGHIKESVKIWQGDTFVTGSRIKDLYTLLTPITSKTKLIFTPFSNDLQYYMSSSIIIDHYNDLHLQIPVNLRDNLIYSNGGAKLFAFK